MLQSVDEEENRNGESKINSVECEGGEGASMLNSPNRSIRPSCSMVIQKAKTMIPAELVAEAMSTLHGVELRWSGPITPTEMQYVEQYVFAKYPEYSNGLVQHTDLYTLSTNQDFIMSNPSDNRNKSPQTTHHSSNPIIIIQLEPSKLVDTLAQKASLKGNFMSIPEIQARNGALHKFGLSEEDYLVVFTPSAREGMMMVGESYPFFRGNYYMTIIDEERDAIRGFVSMKDSKVVAAPESWLDLRIKGSQLSQYFRRKCKHAPKGLFAYPAPSSTGPRSSLHWISEAHRNSWHVMLDATALDPVEDRLSLALHRPDFVLCSVSIMHAHPANITCLLVRKKSFHTAPPASE